MSDDQLEAEFKALTKVIVKQIDAKMAIARKAVDEALELADKHGIPFYADVSSLSQPYIPRTFHQRFGKLKPELVEELAGVSSYDLGRTGWRTSMIC